MTQDAWAKSVVKRSCHWSRGKKKGATTHFCGKKFCHKRGLWQKKVPQTISVATLFLENGLFCATETGLWQKMLPQKGSVAKKRCHNQILWQFLHPKMVH